MLRTALRTIGRPDIPYRVAALAGFTSYAVGHNVGASAFTGGRRALAQWRHSDLRLDQLQTVDALILLNQPVNAFGRSQLTYSILLGRF